MFASPGRGHLLNPHHTMFSFTATPPLSLYVHIPWCVKKCPYCDFNSHEARADLPIAAYIDALIADLEQNLSAVWGRTVETIFFGGGTPSLFPPAAIEELLGLIRARVALKPDAEITLEANPGTVDQSHFDGFRAAGINRLSIGVQSFQPHLLEKIGRIHDDAQALAAITAAQQAGFENINIDLMYGLPGQTDDETTADLATAIDLGPAHISWYELTIEPNTWFYQHPPERPDADRRWDMSEAGRRQLEAGGYSRYEVSAYARPGQQCRHNLNYWYFGDYLGIGAGAHGKITDAASQIIQRSACIKHPASYIEQMSRGQKAGHWNVLTIEDVLLEYFMNVLRTDNGFTESDFCSATGLAFEQTVSQIEQAIEHGFIERNSLHYQTTAHGQQYLNELLQLWVPGDNQK